MARINVFLLVGLTTSCLLSGCGRTTPTPSAAPQDSVQNQAATAAPPESGTASPTTSNQPRRQNERWQDENGREYLGDVPLDVFFDQPYAIASDTTTLSGTPSLAPATTTPSMAAVSPAETTAATDTTASSGALAWEDMIALSILDAEVTVIRNYLTQALQSVGSYNSSMLSVPPKAAAVAALAQIATQHPEAISWKDDAHYIRNLAKKMNESTLQRGKKDQSRLLVLFENMTDTFNRSRPAGLEDPPADDGFVDVAEMRLLMMRMEEAEKKLKTEAGSESAFTSKKDMVKHEAAILATMTKVITLEGYGYEDDEEFVGYAQRIIDAAQAMQNATATDDFSSYELALSKVATSCQECHSVYKNN